MNTQNAWLNFLTSHNAVIQDNEVVEFRADSSETYTNPPDNFICDLSHFGIISISGDDRQTFLQNQLCNDVRDINDNQNQINAYCTPKGRVLALFRLLQRDHEYLLHLPATNVELTIKRLSMFVLMSNVVIENKSDSWVAIGISGDAIANYTNTNIMTLPTEIDHSTQHEHFTAIRIPGKQPRYILFGQTSEMQSLWETITAHYKPANSHAWANMDIQMGLPQVFPDTADAFVPQMLNLHSINGLSFKKGCYPGQEVVARMHYLGKLKRRMYYGHIASDKLPSPGDNLLAADADNKQSVGKIVISAPDIDTGSIFLAVMQISAAESGDITLDDMNKTPVIFKDLPYSVEISREAG